MEGDGGLHGQILNNVNYFTHTHTQTHTHTHTHTHITSDTGAITHALGAAASV
jgi:hypothetical protein